MAGWSRNMSFSKVAIIRWRTIPKRLRARLCEVIHQWRILNARPQTLTDTVP
jgi:hypothetical protein